ncbi:hypothetical protein SAMN04488057_102198 [Cyclobacterium lianum]|uniref:Uncharacterized protein n=1 Tax=Cyclobacterium lianum TaxID=388280 RepID=A0A1M7JYK1_9BACT|nr:hypothetical protein [Cyclobacterium lianum]SHM57607.1 hypothetical protein SAMN04488057_102198 [Cyclobacterium lianum]
MWLVKYFFTFLLVSLGVVFMAFSQEDNCRWTQVSEDGRVFILDSMTVVESTIKIAAADGRSFAHQYEINTGEISIIDENPLPDSLLICYDALSFSLHKVYRRRSLAGDYDSLAFFKDSPPEKIPAIDFREELFTSDKLNQSGNLTRGISFGNTQNVFVNSALNLQMDGELAENLNIRASITDQQVPFQPEGNTQQIQDFDNVLIELYNEKFNLAAGDVVLQQRQSEFLRYYKNVQGLQFTSEYEVNENWTASSQAGAAIAKGKFASVMLDVLEGVSGPYRIRGPGNERFVIIMANSERVFLDGKQLKRGFNQDYIIDYNQGEITFTPTVLITQYSRVRVDFEYAERNFSRSVLTANHIQQNGKVKFYVNFYQEKDDRNRPLFTELSEKDKRLLAGAGDNLGAAAVPRIDSIPFDANRIMYRRVTETNEKGEAETYYTYSTDPDLAHFVIGFTEVGPGMGNYRRQRQLANGSVYEYVPPIQGLPQGDFSIRSPLPAPNKKQMITAGTEIELGAYEKVFSEWAVSDTDDNLFSPLDNEDNKGQAIKAGIRSSGRTFKAISGYRFNALSTMEYNAANFSFIDRLRFIEFDRDWGLNPSAEPENATEKIFHAGAQLQKDQNNIISYSLDLRDRSGVVSGIQQKGKINQKFGKRLLVRNDFFHLESNLYPLRSSWIRYNGELSYLNRFLIPGYSYQLDRNVVSLPNTENAVSTAMNFDEHLFSLQSSDSLKYQLFASVSLREDRAVDNGQLVPDTEAFSINYRLKGEFGPHILNGSFTYRELTFLNRDLQEETTVMGKLDYRSALFDNNLNSELSYALGNGRELRREFVFLPVPTGEGTHTWRDDNEDGVQQLNEFYLAINPEEKSFIKVFVPTDTYVQAYTTLFNYRLNGKFPSSWRDEGGLKRWLSKFSNNTNWNVEKKITARDFFQRISPLLAGTGDESLLSLRQTFRSSFFFNRSSSEYGLDLSFFNSHQKQLLTAGFEELYQDDWRLNARYSIDSKWNMLLFWNSGSRYSDSDFLDNRSYTIQQNTLGPEINLQPSPSLRGTFQYRITQKKNLANLEFDEKARLHEALLSLRISKALQTTINAQIKYTYIDYNGQVNSPTGYEMLQALTPGNNTIWSMNWLQKIGEGLQLNMVYEGRNSQGLDRLVHTGRMQVSALF